MELFWQFFPVESLFKTETSQFSTVIFYEVTELHKEPRVNLYILLLIFDELYVRFNFD